MTIPAALLRHRFTVEPYLGSSATGPLYGPPVERRCLAEALTRSVRTPDGRVVVSGTVLRTDLSYDVPPESRLTYRDRAVEVVSMRPYDGGGLPVWDHLEIVVQ